MNRFFVLASLAVSALAAQAHASDLTVYQNSLKDCTDVDQSAGRCQKDDPTHHVACITYENSTWDVKTCDLRGNALLVEDYTGNTKEVTDFRTEKLFPHQQQRICFNFEKDTYNLWKLKKVGVPTHSCVVSGSGMEPKDKCDVKQGNCERPNIDSTKKCSPYDWGCKE